MKGWAMPDDEAEPRAPRAVHPIAFFVLYLPFGAVGGYVGVLGYELRDAGASVAAIAGLAGMLLLPNTWKVLWAPLVDTTLGARAWCAIGTWAAVLVYAVGAGVPIAPANMPIFA